MRLYHYLPAQYALDNLQHRHLKIALLNDLNDPFELIAADHSNKTQRDILKGWKKTQEKKAGVLCFSKTWQNPIMWSHYADKHRGMVLGFEVANDLLMPVTYTKKRVKIDILKLFNEGRLTSEHTKKMLSTKYEGWRYEQEVRVYATLKARDKETGLYYADFSEKLALKMVIAGPLCTVTKKEILPKLHEKNTDIKIIKSRLAFQSFNVVENKQGF